MERGEGGREGWREWKDRDREKDGESDGEERKGRMRGKGWQERSKKGERKEEEGIITIV